MLYGARTRSNGSHCICTLLYVQALSSCSMYILPYFFTEAARGPSYSGLYCQTRTRIVPSQILRRPSGFGSVYDSYLCDVMTLTLSRSSLWPLSIGPALLPSSSMSLCPPSPFCFPASMLGACTKHVKWKSVSRFGGIALWPVLATLAWMSANRGVFSRSLALSAGFSPAGRHTVRSQTK